MNVYGFGLLTFNIKSHIKSIPPFPTFCHFLQSFSLSEHLHFKKDKIFMTYICEISKFFTEWIEHS